MNIPNFLGLLTILFIGLKLTGYILWSWWWVLSPFWIPVAIILLIAAGAVAIDISGIFKRRRKFNRIIKKGTN